MIILPTALSAALTAACVLVVLRAALSFHSLLYLLIRCWRWLDERTQSHQIYKIPRFDGESSQENPLYRKAAAYIGSLSSLEDSDFANLFSSGRKPNDFYCHLDSGRSVLDSFRGARLSWTAAGDCFLLRLRRQDRHRVLRPFLHHVETVADEIEARKKETKLFTNCVGGGWKSVPFTHPASLDSIAMDPDLKSRVKSDLESFLKGRAYYARLGRVWKRSYLLYGPPGTGKSSFVAAMAKFLCYDVYDLDLSRVSDLKSLLLQTSPKSVILVEDLDRYLSSGGKEVAAAMLNFMDGVFSCCGEERVMVFTMSGAKEAVDPAVLRPGRLDVHIYFPLCDFTAFKTLASSYLGLKDHKLYPQVEEGFQSGAKLSPAEVGEIMIANRGSPSRALKSVINALNQATAGSGRRGGRALSDSGPLNGSRTEEVEGCGVGSGLGFGKDATVREFRKLYGLIRMRSGKKEGTMSVEMAAAAAAAAGGGAAINNSEKDGL